MFGGMKAKKNPIGGKISMGNPKSIKSAPEVNRPQGRYRAQAGPVVPPFPGCPGRDGRSRRPAAPAHADARDPRSRTYPGVSSPAPGPMSRVQELAQLMGQTKAEDTASALDKMTPGHATDAGGPRRRTPASGTSSRRSWPSSTRRPHRTGRGRPRQSHCRPALARRCRKCHRG